MSLTKDSNFNKPNIQYCQYCGKECKNTNSLVNHERLCKKNPNHQVSSWVEYNNSHEVWNKGLTKETDERVRKYSEKLSEVMTGKSSYKHTEEEKQRLRECALERGLGGFNMRKKGIYYNGIKLDSSYEVMVAESLDNNNIKWERPHRIAYHINDDLHYYTPDFYLPDYDVYLDPKNDFLINNINPHTGIKDTDKICIVEEENNIKVLVLDKNQLDWSVIKELVS